MLRALELEDLEDIQRIRSEYENNKLYAGFPFPVSRINEKYWLKSLYSTFSRNRIDYAIVLRRSQRMVGMIGIRDIDALHRRGQYSIIIEKAARGKGYGRESSSLLLDHAFGDLNLNRIQLLVLKDNSDAIVLYSKLGFRKEGELRDYFFQDSRYKKMVIMGLLSRDWLKMKGR